RGRRALSARSTLTRPFVRPPRSHDVFDVQRPCGTLFDWRDAGATASGDRGAGAAVADRPVLIPELDVRVSVGKVPVLAGTPVFRRLARRATQPCTRSLSLFA